MENYKLTKKHIHFVKSAKDWKDAIRISAQSLLKDGYICESYIDGMISSVEKHGPYIVIAPNIAMPHARPEAGANKIGYAITKFEEDVVFDEKGELTARLFITLSCVEADSHIKMMQHIVTILSDSEKHDNIFKAQTEEEILSNFVTA